jgi:hypothetical protein
VPLDPSALRAAKRSQVVARAARLDRTELHGRTASGALRTLVLCVEHVALPSIRRSEIAIEPTGRLGFEGVRCNDAYLDVIALWAFEQPVFETYGSCRNAFQHHPRLTTETTKALDSGQRLFG